jgi:hypothetical protein
MDKNSLRGNTRYPGRIDKKVTFPWFSPFIGQEMGATGGSSSISVTVPSETKKGDLMLLYGGTRNASKPSFPSGWTEIWNQDEISGEYSALYSKISDGTETNLTMSSSYDPLTLYLTVFRGFSDEIESMSGNTNISNITGSRGNLLVCTAVGYYTDMTIYKFGDAHFLGTCAAWASTPNIVSAIGYKILSETGTIGNYYPSKWGSGAIHQATGLIFKKNY